MKPSILGKVKMLPESLQEYQIMDEGQRLAFRACIQCREPFSVDNVKTPAGWRETQITGYCEDCFDKLFAEDDNGEDGVK
jgi:hypothetical protein